MARRVKKKLPKQRNFYAASLFDPTSPYLPKALPTKKERTAARQFKHKGKRHDSDD